MAELITAQILHRRDTKFLWEQNNPILGPGEFGVEQDNITYRVIGLKIGNGEDAWLNLDYFDARDVPIEDVGAYFVGDFVEDALQQLGSHESETTTAHGGIATDAQGALADSAVQPAEITDVFDPIGSADIVQDNLDVETATRISQLADKANLVNGLVPTSELPSITVLNRVVVANATERLALLVPGDLQAGDVAVQTDTATTWLLIDDDASVAANWKPIDQADAVATVNGQSGTVVLGPGDVGAATAAQGTTADSALQPGDIGNTVQAHSTVLDATTASYTQAEETKLANVEALADVTDAVNVAAAGAVMDSEVDVDIKTLALPASTTISTFGATLIDDTTDAAARTTLGLGSASTTASTDYATAAQGTNADTAVQPGDDADTLSSGIAGDGQVLAADGIGGAVWETPASGVTDHGLLTGLVDDDHTQYALANGTRGDFEPTGTVATHEADTTAVHGIADTAALLDNTDVGVSVQAHSAVLDATTASFLTADETKLDGIEALATADQTGTEIKTAYEAEANTNAYTDTEKSKLTGIEALADVTDATNVDAAGAVMDTDIGTTVEAFVDRTGATTGQVPKLQVGGTLAFEDDTTGSGGTNLSWSAATSTVLSDTGTDATVTSVDATNPGLMSVADKSKLDDVETAATADQTAGEIKTAYESNANTNEFSDAEQIKLGGIEALADVTDATNVDAAGAVMDTDIGTAVEAFVDRTGATTGQVPKLQVGGTLAFEDDTTGSGGTNLTWDATTSTVASDTGTDATVTSVDATNPGLMSVSDKSKLDGVEALATADQSAAEIKTAYESNADTNEFSDAEQTKLTGIEALAEVNTVTPTNTATLTNKTLSDFSNTIDADGLHIEVYNNTGVTIAKGTPVYISGVNVGAALPEVAPSDATDLSKMPAIGVAETAITTGGSGSVSRIGRISGIDTSAWTIGDLLYVSETAGEITVTRPTAPAISQQIASVLYSHASAGVLDIASADALIPASETAVGGVKLATEAEALAGTDPLRVITPATLAAVSGTTLAASGEYAVTTVAASGSTETLTLAPAHRVTMDVNCTFTFPTPTEDGHTFLLWLSGAFTPTFPASVVTAPAYVDATLYGATTLDGGTSWVVTVLEDTL